jgi:hypothetical protein
MRPSRQSARLNRNSQSQDTQEALKVPSKRSATKRTNLEEEDSISHARGGKQSTSKVSNSQHEVSTTHKRRRTFDDDTKPSSQPATRSSARNSPGKAPQGSTLSQTQNDLKEALGPKEGRAKSSEQAKNKIKQTLPEKKLNALDFNFNLGEMRKANDGESAEDLDNFKMFKSKRRIPSYFSIKDMQCKSIHLVKNKISDKLSRRDIHYYDMYALQQPHASFDKMRTEGFPYTQQDAKIKELYGDLAFPDFNQIFSTRGDIVSQQYGKTISVTLNVSKTASGGMKVSRTV